MSALGPLCLAGLVGFAGCSGFRPNPVPAPGEAAAARSATPVPASPTETSAPADAATAATAPPADAATAATAPPANAATAVTPAAPTAQSPPAKAARADAAKPQVAHSAKSPSPPAAAPTVPKAAAGTVPPSAPALDLQALEQRLRDTHAIGVFTKLSLKNQVDDLLGELRAFHGGRSLPPLPDLRQHYDLLLMKVLTLLQDGDPPLASAIRASREAIWGMLADPEKFHKIELG
jgi:hypothetical protein